MQEPTARQRWLADIERYRAGRPGMRGPLKRLRILLLTEGLWAISTYRFGQYLYDEAPRFVRALLFIPYELARKLLELAIDIHLHPSTRIGPGLYIAHYGGIWVNPRATLGSHCNLAHGVTIGAPAASVGAPLLGDRVWIGSGAVISGRVRVGSGVVIGANSLVVASLPENAVAVGVPARVISYSGSAALLRVPVPDPETRSENRT
jgi:serine O-acetyltransferase